MHDFVRESVRAALMKARPVPQFAVEISAHPTATPSLVAESPGGRPDSPDAAWRSPYIPGVSQPFSLQAPVPPPTNERFQFGEGFSVDGNAALSLVRAPEPLPNDTCAPPIPDEAEAPSDLAPALTTLKPLGQIRDSFILAVNPEGLWIVDQHVAHDVSCSRRYSNSAPYKKWRASACCFLWSLNSLQPSKLYSPTSPTNWPKTDSKSSPLARAASQSRSPPPA